jgi:hypothetical protein
VRERFGRERAGGMKKIREQMLVANVAILAGLAYGYWSKMPVFFIVPVTVMMLLLANFIFLVRMLLYVRANKKP